MRIGIDGYYLIKKRGMGRYVQELLYSLGSYSDNEFEFFVIVPETVTEDAYILPGRINYVRIPNASFPIWEQWRLPRQFQRLNLDIVHFPYNTSSLAFGDSRTKRVVTIHDLIFMDAAQGRGASWYQNFGNKYRKALVGRLNPDGQIIVTDSHRSAEEIHRQLGLTSEVVYIPAQYALRELYDKEDPPSPVAFKYFLHVGGTSPHKNTDRCIKAYLAVRPKDTALVVLGMGRDSALALCYESDQIIFPGWVSEKEMLGYYHHAEAVLFPSLVEGYGMPIVEAFSLGAPVITSNLDPMKEIAGGAAYLVDPYSPESIGEAISTLYSDETVRAKLRQAGYERLSTINSEVMANQMIAVYRKALKSR